MQAVAGSPEALQRQGVTSGPSSDTADTAEPSPVPAPVTAAPDPSTSSRAETLSGSESPAESNGQEAASSAGPDLAAGSSPLSLEGGAVSEGSLSEGSAQPLEDVPLLAEAQGPAQESESPVADSQTSPPVSLAGGEAAEEVAGVLSLGTPESAASQTSSLALPGPSNPIEALSGELAGQAEGLAAASALPAEACAVSSPESVLGSDGSAGAPSLSAENEAGSGEVPSLVEAVGAAGDQLAPVEGLEGSGSAKGSEPVAFVTVSVLETDEEIEGLASESAQTTAALPGPSGAPPLALPGPSTGAGSVALVGAESAGLSLFSASSPAPAAQDSSEALLSALEAKEAERIFLVTVLDTAEEIEGLADPPKAFQPASERLLGQASSPEDSTSVDSLGGDAAGSPPLALASAEQAPLALPEPVQAAGMIVVEALESDGIGEESGEGTVEGVVEAVGEGVVEGAVEAVVSVTASLLESVEGVGESEGAGEVGEVLVVEGELVLDGKSAFYSSLGVGLSSVDEGSASLLEGDIASLPEQETPNEVSANSGGGRQGR